MILKYKNIQSMTVPDHDLNTSLKMTLKHPSE